MNESQRNALVALSACHADEGEGIVETAIPGVVFFRATKTSTSIPTVYNPSICIIVQGAKEVALGKQIYTYAASEYLIASVDLPVMGRITQASQEQSYLAIKIDIDTRQLSELLIHCDHLSSVTKKKAERGLFIGKTDVVLGEAVLRLLHLLASPEDIPVLAEQTLREVYYRMLCSDYGETIAQIVMQGSHMQRIGIAIEKLKRDFHAPISVESLAKLAGMSVSSFHAHFKAVTTMSPLQFQKSIRLMAARNLLVTEDLDAASTAYRVGYESPSQFSREYARMFGNPPGRDKNLLTTV